MRKCLILFTLCSVLLCLPAGCGISREVQPGMTVTAHAGALKTEDNTLESVKAGLECVGSGCIEVDVRFLKDGTPVLHHNKASESCTRLEDVFRLMQDYKGSINLDLKEHSRSFAEGTAEMAIRYGLQERAFFTGVSAENLPAVIRTGLRYYLNCEPTDDNAMALLETAQQMEAEGLNIHYKLCTEKLVNNAHEMGLKISVWTVNSRPHMKKMIRMGVDNITTRKPDVLLKLIGGAGGSDAV